MNTQPSLRSILLTGKIGRAHGLQGEVKVQALTSDPDRFYDLKDCLLVSPDEKMTKEARIAAVRMSADQILVRLEGCFSREDAEKLNGWYLAVSRENAVKLPADTWFICDLTGCAVFDENAGYIGDLAEVIQNSSQDVYVVRLSGQDDLLFPALKSIIRKVDIDGRRIDVVLPDGLYEIYR